MMASADDGNGDQHRINIGNAGVVQVADDAVMISRQSDCPPQIEVQHQPSDHPDNVTEELNQFDINIGNASSLKQSRHVVAVTNQEEARPPLSRAGGDKSLEVDGTQELVGQNDKSTDTREDWMYARGHSMGEANSKRLHFCYHEGLDLVQIANCCTYIELNINPELVQKLRNQGLLTVEIPLPNGPTLVTFRWGSLEANREYIRCELKAELQDEWKCIDWENEYLKSLLCNSDCQVEKIVEYFYQMFNALILKIENGCLLFKILVQDMDALDRLCTTQSLDKIAKFLDKLFLTNEMRRRTGDQQVFRVRLINKGFRARPDTKHMIQFDTRASREFSADPTEGNLTYLIEKIVSQELQASLSQLQVSLTDRIARTVVEEMQKFGKLGPSISREEPTETVSRSLDLPRIQDLNTSIEQDRASIGHHGTVSGSISPGHPSMGPMLTSQGLPSAEPEITSQSISSAVPGISSQGLSSAGPGIFSQCLSGAGPRITSQGLSVAGPGITSQDLSSAGPGIFSQGLSSAGPGITPQGLSSAGPGISSQGLSDAVPGITSQDLSSAGQGSTSSEHLSTGPGNMSPKHPSAGPGITSPGRPSTGSETYLGPGSTHPDTYILSPPSCRVKEDVNQGERSRRMWRGDPGQHAHKKPSFASILFNLENTSQLWPDQAQRAEMEKCFQLKGIEDPLDEDIQQDLQYVKKLVDVGHLAKLMTMSVLGETSQHSHAHGLHTVLCLDVSESMRGEPIQKLTECAKTFRNEIEDNTMDLYLEENVGVVLLGGDVDVQLLPTNDYSKLEEAIRGLNVKGETCPLLEGLIACILLLFRTEQDEDPYFTIGEYHHHCLYPRIILMSDGLTSEGGHVSGIDDITDEVYKAVCTYLPRLLKASNNICRISCVQFENNVRTSKTNVKLEKKCRSMINKLSQETGGDTVDPTQIQWLSHYSRLQNAIGKVLDWNAGKKGMSKDEIEERIGEEFSDSNIEDIREQEHVREEVWRIINIGPDVIQENLACGESHSAAESHGVYDTSATPHVLRTGDKVREVPDETVLEQDKTDSFGIVIGINQKDDIVKVKWSIGTEDYYKHNQLQLWEVHPTKPSEISNLQVGGNDLQVDCDPDSDAEDQDQYLRESDVALTHHHSPFSWSPTVETGGQVKDFDHKIVWQRKVRGDRWEVYSPEQIEMIEKSYTSRSESCVIGSPGKQIQ
ncbi:uncharacterized protein LOC117333999 [Pecten maximus]|uniref:uncharacterized protein LOC117333999 n=1 Tax=Pecten maximus TaxID=6579 RepID=UPI00145918B1|nr:uncharacterized protein LOC117333999 [Pecten maximus]